MNARADGGLPLIRLRGIGRRYGAGATEVHALRDVDLDIREGEFVAIMGPSGSGKSTAMNIIGCLDTPSSGEYLFEGRPVQSLTRDGRAVIGFGPGREYEYGQFLADAAEAGFTPDLLLSTWDVRPFTDDAEFLVAILRPA